jgi:hypothetical protein
VRELRSGEPLPAPQTAGHARGVVRLEAGKQPLDRRNRHPNRLFPHPSAEKPAAPRSAFAAPRPISYLRRASLEKDRYR